MLKDNKSEIEKIAERYDRRLRFISKDDKYSMLNPSVWQGVQERQRIILKILNRFLTRPINKTSVLEIGCGGGGNLLELLRIGFAPKLLVGNELLPTRLTKAKLSLPKSCKLIAGDALKLNFPESSFDIVYQSTVFSSILDNEFQIMLAHKMWAWVKPGGGIIWYDFIYNNPNNTDVKGVSIKRIHELFPDGEHHIFRVTLAPPISRYICRMHPSLYILLNLIPMLRTHVICWIGKPSI